MEADNAHTGKHFTDLVRSLLADRFLAQMGLFKARFLLAAPTFGVQRTS